MRAIQIASYGGPEALRLADIEPDPGQEARVRIAVHAAGVSFPELLQSRGAYQVRPPLPFVPGTEVAGIVEHAPSGSAFKPGDRVFAAAGGGGFAEVAFAREELTFRLSDRLSFAKGAALFLNYHSAYFALFIRGRARAGETVLVHGAAGGVGSATLQLARARGLRAIAVVSTEAKAEVARQAGASDVVRSDGSWKDDTLALAPGGVDVVVDTVGDRALDSLRALTPGGRMIVVGFASGMIPEIKVNRLLLRNLELIGSGYGEHFSADPSIAGHIAGELDPMIDDGAIDPVIGSRFALGDAADALRLLESRRATGKVVLDVRPEG